MSSIKNLHLRTLKTLDVKKLGIIKEILKIRCDTDFGWTCLLLCNI